MDFNIPKIESIIVMIESGIFSGFLCTLRAERYTWEAT